jgi:hypothetical protein
MAYQNSGYETNFDPSCPWKGVAQFWPGAVGGDTDITKAGRCPKELRVANSGTLAVQFIDGTSLTLAANHLTQPLPAGNITKILAAGSTAFNILVGY